MLLAIARESATTVEIGTGSGWTAISLALAHPRRRVTTYDKGLHPLRDLYAALAAKTVSERVTFVRSFGERGPDRPLEIDFLFIDSSHKKDETVATFRAWEPHVRSGGTVVFDDYRNPTFPGVTEAIEELQLLGSTRLDSLFVWRKP